MSTAAGVILGVGATSFNERIKWKRERRKALYESRSKLYADYLADLTKTRDAIRLVGRSSQVMGQSIRQAAEVAFASANLYARRYQIRITCPADTAAAATRTLRALRDIRDAVAHGEYHAERYYEAKGRYESALQSLMDSMEQDLELIR